MVKLCSIHRRSSAPAEEFTASEPGRANLTTWGGRGRDEEDLVLEVGRVVVPPLGDGGEASGADVASPSTAKLIPQQLVSECRAC